MKKFNKSSSSLAAEMWSKKRAGVIPNKTKHYVPPLSKSRVNKDKSFYKSLDNDHNYFRSKNCIFLQHYQDLQ